MSRLRQRPGTKLRTTISVHLKKSLEILTLNSVELSQSLHQLLQENIFLEEVRPPEVSLDEFMLQQRPGHNNTETTFETYAYKEQSLQEYLNEQLQISDLSGRLAELASLIITSVDKNGFINMDHETLALNNGYTLKELSRVLNFIRQLDPSGVCARDTWQSLEWQASLKYPDDLVLGDIIATLQQGKKEITSLDNSIIDSLKEYLHLSLSQIKDALKKLNSLDINPAGRFKVHEQNYIVPEIIYSVKNDSIQINFSNPLLPDVTLNDEMFASLRKDKNKKQWREMYNEAKNLIKSVNYRKSSLLRIAKIIAARQELFFKKGEKFLKPMILKDIAEVTHLNISTISRILKNKYCVTPYGIVPLSYFLMKKVKTMEDENLGVEDLKKSIRFIVDQENKKRPLSDQLIMEKLQDFGFNVKRRTVAKYRKLLHIPSAKQRTVT